jgi:uncharacterized iron-regulated membrane protein
VVGETPPAPRGAAPAQPGGNAATQRGGAERRGEGTPVETASADINLLWARAEQHMPGWRSISLRLPSPTDSTLTYTLDRGDGGQPQDRAQLTLDRKTGEVVRWEPFSSLTPGRRLRSLLRFAHTGEVLGVVGQTVAGLASAAGALLVWTGLALAWRRSRAWLARRRGRAITEQVTTASAPAQSQKVSL